MIVVAAKFNGKPERRMDLLLLANAFVPPTRAEEGCISCSFYEQQPGRNEFLFFEEWKDRAALTAHFATPHFQHFMKQKLELINNVHDVRIYHVEAFEDGTVSLLPETSAKID